MPNPDGTMTLEEKVAKLEKEMAEAAPSPTGTPLIPPKAFAVIALIVGLALAVLGALVGFYPEVKGFGVALAITTAVAGVLGIASPGLRKAAVVLLMVVSVTGLTGCTVIKRIGKTTELAAPKVLDCVGKACMEDFPVLMGIAAKELMSVVAGGKFDVEPVIDNLLTTAKDPDLMACVIREVLQAWQQAGSGAGLQLPEGPENQRLLFIAAHVGQTHLLAKGFVPK